MKQHTVHRLPRGAFTTRMPPQRPWFPPTPRHIVGEEELPPPRYRIPLTSTPAPAEAPPDESAS